MSEPQEGGLSPGAAGILGMIGMAILMYRHRKNAREMELKNQLQNDFYEPGTGTSKVPTFRVGTRHTGEPTNIYRGPNLRPTELQRYRSPSLKEEQNASQQGPSPEPLDFVTPDTREDREESTPVYELGANNEVQLAQPQRLSRGYARVVHTQTHGSNGSVPADSARTTSGEQ